jgi:hypothetical protein
MRAKKRVRVHLVDEGNSQLPSIEGLLLSRRGREYAIAVPKLLLHPDAQPTELDSRWLEIPRERVAFYEVL